MGSYRSWVVKKTNHAEGAMAGRNTTQWVEGHSKTRLQPQDYSIGVHPLAPASGWGDGGSQPLPPMMQGSLPRQPPRPRELPGLRQWQITEIPCTPFHKEGSPLRRGLRPRAAPVRSRWQGV